MVKATIYGDGTVNRVVNKKLYPDGRWLKETNNEFFTRVCVWATHHGLDEPEFLLPQIVIGTAIDSFLFERIFARGANKSPSKTEIDALGPWDYQIEWPGVSTRNQRIAKEWLFHRYRAAMFGPLIRALAGSQLETSEVLDVACHCGVFAMEIAAHGIKKVRGFDLRQENINKANFLKSSFNLSQVEFLVQNAADLSNYQADIVLCGGLLYHVTFPVKLVEDLFACTRKYLILDSLCQNHPISGMHIYGERNTNSSIEGEQNVELVPTYRGIIDLLRSAGFRQIYEILGSLSQDVPYYNSRNIRSFLCIKPECEVPESELTTILQE